MVNIFLIILLLVVENFAQQDEGLVLLRRVKGKCLKISLDLYLAKFKANSKLKVQGRMEIVS